mgnify:CR=1 FL=1
MTKPTLEQYPAWAKDNIGFDPSNAQVIKRYERNSVGIRGSIVESAAWSSVSDLMEALTVEYIDTNRVNLFTDAKWTPTLHIKPFSSVVEKSFRRNVLNNDNYPEAPTAGWITEDNLFMRMTDLVRCRVVCRYMDGPEFICEEAAKRLGADIVSGVHSMETELGYYAWHLGVFVTAPIVKPNGDVAEEKVQLEVQLTTHLNDVLNDLTHVFYEGGRVATAPSDSRWKWQPYEAKFKGAYFGHTLHLLEGMIVELKNEMAKEAKND